MPQNRTKTAAELLGVDIAPTAQGRDRLLVTAIELFYTPGPSTRHQAVRHLERLQAAHPSRIRIVYRLVKGSSARLHYAALHAYADRNL